MRSCGGLIALVFAASVLLGSCGGGEDSVPWDNYAPSVQSRIQSMIAAENCAGLQREFDSADANDDATRRRTGIGNSALMAYLDEAMADAGCYL